jgi:hypothetical protein
VGGGKSKGGQRFIFQAAQFLPWIFILGWGFLAFKVGADFTQQLH